MKKNSILVASLFACLISQTSLKANTQSETQEVKTDNNDGFFKGEPKITELQACENYHLRVHVDYAKCKIYYKCCTVVKTVRDEDGGSYCSSVGEDYSKIKKYETCGDL